MVDLKAVLSGACTVLVSACGLLPSTPYQRPDVPLPAQWSVWRAASGVPSQTGDAPACDSVASAPVADRWWRCFGDTRLTALVDEVLDNNTDIKTAAEQCRKAELELASTRAQSGPRVAGDVQHHWGSALTRRSRGADATVSITQDLDLWGVQAGTREAAAARARAAALARAESARHQVGLTSKAYWEVAWMNERESLSRVTLDEMRRAEALAVARHAHGATGAEPVSAATARIADMEAELIGIAERRQKALNALAYLLGRPGDPPALADARLPASARLPEVNAGVPADLLARRPDVQRKEWQLRATLAEVDVSKANLYPRISLTGRLGTASNDLVSLVTRPVSTLSAQIALPFLNWRIRRLDVDVAEATHRLATLAFEQTLHRALQEVEDALVARHRHIAEEAARVAALNARDREETLAASRYREGATDLGAWLEKRATRQAAAAALLRTRFERANNMITLYLALGGEAVTVE